jgi:hypothetical protein
MADKALTDPASVLGNLFSTMKSDPKPVVGAVLAPVCDSTPRVLKGRISAVGDDDKKGAPPTASNAATNLLKRLYGL